MNNEASKRQPHQSRQQLALKLPRIDDQSNQAELNNNRRELTETENALFHGARTNWLLHVWNHGVIDYW